MTGGIGIVGGCPFLSLREASYMPNLAASYLTIVHRPPIVKSVQKILQCKKELFWAGEVLGDPPKC